MKIYIVYAMNEEGNLSYPDSYWTNFENAKNRAKKINIFATEPNNIECVETND